MSKAAVKAALFAGGAALLAFDLYLLRDGEADNTISNVVLQTAKERPVSAFLAGMVAGHLYWPNNPENGI